MQKTILLLLVVFFKTIIGFCQSDRKQLTGSIQAYNQPVEGIMIINKNSESSTESTENGSFEIYSKPGDTLLFSSSITKSKEIIVSENDLESKNLKVNLTLITNELNEVVITNYKRINARALRIIPESTKSYTPAVRKYRTATNFGSQGTAGITLDPLLNYFSGRTAMLKKEVEIEKKESYLFMLNEMFSADHFVYNLKIPREYIKGFQYYAVENKYFTNILKTKNKTSTAFLLSELAMKYKDLLACENEE